MIGKILEWVSWIALGLTAFLQALDQSIRDRPKVAEKAAFVNSDWWNYLPLFLIVVGLIAIGVRAIFIKKKLSGKGFPDGWDERMKTISDHQYANERIVIDGLRFVRCQFANVTLIYNGTGPFEIADLKLVPGTTVVYQTENKALDSYGRLITAIHSAPGVSAITYAERHDKTGEFRMKHRLEKIEHGKPEEAPKDKES